MLGKDSTSCILMHRGDSMQPKIDVGPFSFLPASVRVQGRPPIEEWIGPLQFALWCQRASPWWIGDLLISGDARFGEAFSQACEGLVSAEMLQRYESVARRVPAENRRSTLSWSAHAAVARLPHKRQREMLAAAVQHGWSSEVLRVKVRESLKGSKP
jgi:hypothetical protein